MKRLKGKNPNSKDNDILKFRELFRELKLKLKEREIEEIKSHFEEMANLLVNIWLEGKESLANKNYVRRIKKRN
ncbi:MAG: hypothetical protein WC283_00395 [Candidatus Paceibacterota bacterium]|jgi:hypothetical protein